MLLRLCLLVATSGSAVVLVAAAAPALEGSYLRAEDYRVAEIGHAIGVRAAAHCPERVPQPGFQLHHLFDYAPADRARVIERRRLDLGPGLLSVVAHSPAARAGLEAGDVLLAVDDNSLAAVASGSARDERARVRTLLDKRLTAGEVELRIHRAGENRSVRLTATQGCPSRVRLARNARATAVADDGEVVVTTGLLREVKSDDELAAIIGHEAAHITLGHADRLRAQGVPRGFLREFGANAARVLATEAEADRLGIRLGWAAGYDMNAAIPFWRRFYARYDGPRLFRTHPGLAARERIIRETLAELEAGAQRPELGKSALGDR